MTPMKTLIEQLADAFMACPLPDSVCPDPCAMMKGYPNRVGTNLLTVVEAQQMFEHVLAKVRPSSIAVVLEAIEADAKACDEEAMALKEKKDELNAYLMSSQAMAHRLDIQRIKNAIATKS